MHSSTDKNLINNETSTNNKLQIENVIPVFNSDDNEIQTKHKLRRKDSRFEITTVNRLTSN